MLNEYGNWLKVDNTTSADEWFEMKCYTKRPLSWTKVGLELPTETETGDTDCAENKILQLRDERNTFSSSGKLAGRVTSPWILSSLLFSLSPPTTVTIFQVVQHVSV